MLLWHFHPHVDHVSGRVGESERADDAAYVRTAESEKEAAARLFLLPVRSGLEEGGGGSLGKRTGFSQGT